MSDMSTTTQVPVAPATGARHGNPSSVRNGLLCVLIVAACFLVIYPVVNGPGGDDFSYTKTALDFEQSGKLLYNGWATAMLGWLIPWGALFVKLFGFSFTTLRIALLPIAMATVYLLHQVLRRFGINRQNAVFGTLAVALSPIFLFMATGYMTDVPGLLVILVCIYMCQRAVAAQTDRAVLLWLCSAAIVNVAGGTVRQIAWLGSLIMVPSTAWFLRNRRGTKFTVALMWLLSLSAIIACLHWFNRQPYSVPEPILPWPIGRSALVHLGEELVKTFLCLLLVVFPVLVAWMTTTHRLPSKAKRRFAVAIFSLALFAVVLYKAGKLDHWTEPWLIPLLGITVLGRAYLWVRAIISLLVIAPAIILAEQLISLDRHKSATHRDQPPSWTQLAWILGPFSLGYLLLLIPRGTFAEIQDRYLLGLAPIAVIALLKLYQEQVKETLPAASFVALIAVAAIAIVDAHDLFSTSRALTYTVEMVEKSGIPSKSLLAGLEVPTGWARDGWVQIRDGGHINDLRIKVPAGAYRPYPPDLKLPPNCRGWFAGDTPSIDAKYFIVSTPKSCFVATNYPVIHYRTWFPPFRRTLYVEKLAPISTPEP